MKMRRLLKYVLLGLGGLVSLVIIALLVVTFFFGDKVKQAVVDRLGEQFTSEFAIDGPISLQVFQSFPQASVVLSDVKLMERSPGDSLLLHVESLQLRFGIMDILRGKYTIDNIHLSKGRVFMRRLPDGQMNYLVMKPDSSDSNNSARFDIQRAVLDDIQLVYLDPATRQEVRTRLNDTQLTGSFGKDFTLTASATVALDCLNLGGQNFSRPNPIGLRIQLAMNEQQVLRLKEGKLKLDNDQYEVTGSLTANSDEQLLDLAVSGKDIGLSGFASLLPQAIAQHIAGFDSQGELTFAAKIQGDLRKGQPSVGIDFSLDDAVITHEDIGHTLRSVYLQGRFTNGQARAPWSSSLTIREFKGKHGGEDFHGNFSLVNVADPQINMAIEAVVDLEDVAPLFKMDQIKDLQGKLRLRDFRFSGKAVDLAAKFSSGQLKFHGDAEFEDIRMQAYGKRIELRQGRIELDNDNANISALVGTIGESRFQLDVQTTYLPRFLAAMASGRTDLPLWIRGDLTCENLDLHDMSTWEVPSSDAPASMEGNEIAWLNIFRGSLNLHAQELAMQDFRARDVHTKLRFEPGRILMDHTEGQAFSGRVALSGNVVIGHQLKMSLVADAQHIDISQLFQEFGNFGQEVLREEHLSGSLTSDLRIHAIWDQSFNFLEDALTLDANVAVQDGRLSHFAPVKDLSSYVKAEELEDIRFESLKNSIRIAQRVIYIPRMNIRSNALNLTMAGEHHFDNRIDYFFRIDFVDLLARKMRKSSRRADESEDIHESLFIVYARMSGTVDQPEFARKRKEVIAYLYKDDPEARESYIQLLKRKTDRRDKRLDWDEQDDDDIEFIEFDKEESQP